MERESFEDEEVAELLNREYVAIKVDREERPDIDHVYMTVCQAMTGQGGWPLTVIMTPEKQPFYAGTYYPKRTKHGRFGLMDLLEALSEKWQEDQAEIVSTAGRVVEQLSAPRKRGEAKASKDDAVEWDITLLDQAYDQYDKLFDSAYGGLGRAPKFPTSHNISLLLRYYHKTGKPFALEMAEKTLESMRQGGMYDHIGFGFSRYSTDERWLVPHFEKMLYDNALLAMTYIEAYQLTGTESYALTAKEIFAYVQRDMTDRGGAFYSAEDADSEGVEGKFYVWSFDEVIEILGEEDGDLYCDIFDITREGNFEDSNIPNLIGEDLGSYARAKGIPEHELRERVEAARRKLFTVREQRIHPHKDDKILTSWNGLMIMALAKGAKAFGQVKYAEAAERAVQFILEQMVRKDGRLLARYRDGDAAYPAYLDDYAFLAWGLIELYEATGRATYLEQARQLNADMLKLFWDEAEGGFFFSSNDGEQLFMKSKEIYDGAMPAGNSAALIVLAKLSRYLDDSYLREKTEQLMQAFAEEIGGYPAGYSLFLAAADAVHSPGEEIIITGELADPVTQEMLAEARSRYAPDSLIVFHPPGAAGAEIHSLCPLTEDKVPIDGKPTAYVCENFACQAPVTDLEAFRKLLNISPQV
ncbi:MAG: thioredoxin domain-containing protein [Gorillibacterium sp.]|nr:thioredoxin domain-containing protein [Gorillibacterium sp.]